MIDTQSYVLRIRSNIHTVIRTYPTGQPPCKHPIQKIYAHHVTCSFPSVQLDPPIHIAYLPVLAPTQMMLVLLMSFAALLRGPRALQGQPVTAGRRQHKYEARSVDASLAHGERVVAFLESCYGPEASARMLETVARRAAGSQPSSARDEPWASLPYGFWRRFMEEDMKIQFSGRKRQQLIRSLQLYVRRKQEGASTISAMRGMRARGSCRSSGGALNARKAA